MAQEAGITVGWTVRETNVIPMCQRRGTTKYYIVKTVH